jgi:predicted transposase YbfD/YdcC
MDHAHSITLLEAVQRVPDPRSRRGRSFEWSFLLAILLGALTSGRTTGTEITTWATDHAQELLDALKPAKARMPSDATLRRTLRSLNSATLERALGVHNRALDRRDTTAGTLVGKNGQRWRVQAIDGKDVRGARAHGEQTHLVSMVRHQAGYTLAQTAVADKSNEITAVPRLLRKRSLRRTITTMDALLTQRDIARQILQQKGHYLMVVKKNQPDMYAAVELLFREPPVPREPGDFARARTMETGHGRLETRDVTSSPALQGYLDWPGAAQVAQRIKRFTNKKTGEVKTETTYAITSLSADEVGPDHIAQLWRGHWTIENRVFYVRDVTMGEDACQIRVRKSARVLAALRSAIISLFRYHRWQYIPMAFRHYNARPTAVLQLIGALRT